MASLCLHLRLRRGVVGDEPRDENEEAEEECRADGLLTPPNKRERCERKDQDTQRY